MKRKENLPICSNLQEETLGSAKSLLINYSNKKGSKKLEPCCREGGIRTPGTSRYAGFQDRCIRPLCHFSVWSIAFIRRFFKRECKCRLIFFFAKCDKKFYYSKIEVVISILSESTARSTLALYSNPISRIYANRYNQIIKAIMIPIDP